MPIWAVRLAQDWAIETPDLVEILIKLILAPVAIKLLGHRLAFLEDLPRRLGGRGRLARWERACEPYRKRLREDTLAGHYAWMSPGTTLESVLVPAKLDQDNEGPKEHAVLLRRLLDEPAPRCALVGGPGSGKSVALRLAVEEIWRDNDLVPERARLPVLMRFAEWSAAKFDLEDAIATSLLRRKFAAPKNLTTQEQRQYALHATRQLLATGSIALLFDALDELGANEQRYAVERLSSELKHYPALAAFFACRTGVWSLNAPQLTVPYHTLRTTDFTPHAVRRFVRKSAFTRSKSPDALLALLESRADLSELARTPLMWASPRKVDGGN